MMSHKSLRAAAMNAVGFHKALPLKTPHRAFLIPSSKCLNKRNKTSWMKRHVKDPFVRRAQHEGEVSRSFYKLQQMNDKHKLLTNSSVVVELGAAPGGWTSYCLQKLGKDSTIVAIDLLPLDPKVMKQLSESPVESHVIQGDFRSLYVKEQLDSILGQEKADFVLSDMASNFTGDSQTDAARTMGLCETALELAMQHLLRKDGTYLAKYFSCADEIELKEYARQYFRKVKTVKPPASRKQSAERYLIATGFHRS
jgi:23S rRNA (uridine2552-2'-O)-methyltransferase